MTKYFALDASLTNCGWSLWIDGQYHQSGQFKPTGNDWVDKIQSVCRWLYDVSMRHRINVVFYEKPSGKSGGKFGNKETDLKLGALWYAVQLFCRMHNIRFVNVAPSEIKATGICKGNIDNPYKHFVIPTHKDGTIIKAALDRIYDELDAIGCGLAGMEKIKNE